MRIPNLLSETWKRVTDQLLVALVTWTMVFAPAMAAAQDKPQLQKATSASQARPAGVAKASVEKEASAVKSERSGGPQEGIKVHGHWVIEVRNPDGSLA